MYISVSHRRGVLCSGVQCCAVSRSSYQIPVALEGVFLLLSLGVGVQVFHSYPTLCNRNVEVITLCSLYRVDLASVHSSVQVTDTVFIYMFSSIRVDYEL